MNEPLVRNVSDTALWVATYRANENDRADALFRDPYARRLAGERGERIAKAMEAGSRSEWAFIARTIMFDAMLQHAIAAGADTVLNLAAGLDTRPYRMDLPPNLRWIEVDLPAMIDYKEQQLADATPHCKLERVRLDLSNSDARRELFQRIAADSKNTVVVTEGLITYFPDSEVASFARDLAEQPAFKHWITDLLSPRLLKMIGRMYSRQLLASAPLKFAPANGVDFFAPLGWRAVEVRSSLREAAKVKRVGWFYRLLSRIPINIHKPGRQPWSATVMFERVTP